MTQSGVTLGTFDYISPEQALDPRQADVRSDIYSLGCTFYHALTGRPPVPEGTAAKKLHAHQHVAPLDPRELNPAIPDELAAILAGMMAKNPRSATRRRRTDRAPEGRRGTIEAIAGSGRVRFRGSVVPGEASVPAEPSRLRLAWVVAAAAIAMAVATFSLSPPGQSPGSDRHGHLTRALSSSILRSGWPVTEYRPAINPRREWLQSTR